MIQVKKVSDGNYEVKVTGETDSTHYVTLSDDYYQKLARGQETPERLVERSFEFLLRHEPNTSILRAFDLPTINRFFPNFEKEIGGQLGET